MLKSFCDSCGKRVPHPARCHDCSGDTTEYHYHKSCLKKVNNFWYCRYHVDDHVENAMIITYLKRTWYGLKLGGVLTVQGLMDDSDNWSRIQIKFPTYTLPLRGTWDNHSKSLMLRYDGGDEVQFIKLHNHTAFKKALKQLVMAVSTEIIASCTHKIKNSEREIKYYKAATKKLDFIGQVVRGEKKWPKPKVLVTTHEEVNSGT